MPTNKQLYDAAMDALADSINTKAGTSGKKTIPQLKTLVDGISVGVDTSDATATANDILSGTSAYGSAGTKLDGTIPTRTASDLQTLLNNVSVPSGYYASSVSKSIDLGTEGTPIATKGNVSDHSISVTPSVTNTAGYISGGTQTGTAVTVTASELVSDTLPITENGIVDVTNYASVNVNVASGGYTKPSYLISDGDTFSTMYFNTEYSLNAFLAGLTYNMTDQTYGFDYAYLSLSYLIAIDLSTIPNAGLTGYALCWADPNDFTVLYSTSTFDLSSILPGLVVATVGWQVSSFAPSTAQTYDESTSNAAFNSTMDEFVAQDDTAFGSHGGGGKAHTFQIPTITGTYTYSGSSQTPTITGFYADFMTKAGDTSATNAGSYTITFSLLDTTNCQWSDGTTSDKTVSWSIAKAALPKPTLSTGAITLDDSTTSGTFTVSRSGNGVITATSSNPSKISASVSGTTVTVRALDTSAEATANITITVAEGTNYLAYTNTDVKCVVTIAIVQRNALYITTTAANVKPTICLTVTGGNLVIDYGDGSSETVTGTTDTKIIKTHTYANAGNYMITFTPATGVTWTPGVNYQPSGQSYASNWSIVYTRSGTGLISNLIVKKFVGVNGITNLRSSAFANISTLEELVLPNGLISIGSSMCSDCSSLTSVTLPDSLTTFDSSGSNFFYHCTSLPSIKFPDNVTSIGTQMCSGCTSLASVEIGSGVTAIRSQAFGLCTSLMSIKVTATTPPTLNWNALSSVPANCAIYVPAASVADYQAAQYWSNRAQYIQAIPT